MKKIFAILLGLSLSAASAASAASINDIEENTIKLTNSINSFISSIFKYVSDLLENTPDNHGNSQSDKEHKIHLLKQ